jgi:hypothetical protein
VNVPLAVANSRFLSVKTSLVSFLAFRSAQDASETPRWTFAHLSELLMEYCRALALSTFLFYWISTDDPTMKFNWITRSLIVLGSAFLPAFGAKYSGPVAAVVIVVTNEADIPLGELKKSLDIAENLLRPTAIQVNWLLSSSNLQSSNQPSQTQAVYIPTPGIPRIHLHIQSKTDDPKRKWDKPVLGYTRLERDPPVAVVLADHIGWLANHYGIQASLVLACAEVHEIGHVLLRSRGHDAGGIMRAQFRLQDFAAAEQTQLRFLPEEAAKMRTALLAEAARIRRVGTAVTCCP